MLCSLTHGAGFFFLFVVITKQKILYETKIELFILDKQVTDI